MYQSYLMDKLLFTLLFSIYLPLEKSLSSVCNETLMPQFHSLMRNIIPKQVFR